MSLAVMPLNITKRPRDEVAHTNVRMRQASVGCKLLSGLGNAAGPAAAQICNGWESHRDHPQKKNPAELKRQQPTALLPSKC